LKYDGLKWVISDDANGIADVPNDLKNYVWQFNQWVSLESTTEYTGLDTRIQTLESQEYPE